MMVLNDNGGDDDEHCSDVDIDCNFFCGDGNNSSGDDDDGDEVEHCSDVDIDCNFFMVLVMIMILAVTMTMMKTALLAMIVTSLSLVGRYV